MKITKHTIDAKGKKLGRVASEAAMYLMGKKDPDYTPNKLADMKVEIINAKEASISEKKLSEKKYTSYSGYPGGLKHTKMSKVVDDKGFSELFRKAVFGMLPDNKLRAEMMKNLTVTE